MYFTKEEIRHVLPFFFDKGESKQGGMLIMYNNNQSCVIILFRRFSYGNFDFGRISICEYLLNSNKFDLVTGNEVGRLPQHQAKTVVVNRKKLAIRY